MIRKLAGSLMLIYAFSALFVANLRLQALIIWHALRVGLRAIWSTR